MAAEHSLGLLLTAFSIMLVCSELKYRFVETPLRRRGVDIARRRMAAITVTELDKYDAPTTAPTRMGELS